MVRPLFTAAILAVAEMLLLSATTALALDIEIDFTFDSNGFFDPTTTEGEAARAAIEAVAQRYSDVVTTSLGAAEINNFNNGRIGFSNPSTGESIQLSGAASAASDPLVTSAGAAPADIYGTRTFAADTLTIFVGAQPLGGAGVGGTGSGINFTSVFTDDNSHLNRGFRAPGTSALGNLPVWGGAVSFDIDQNWHFGIDTAASFNELDFYSIALHEVGHVLGLNLSFDDFTDHVAGDQFTGPNAVAAANADNGTALTDIDLVSTTNTHFADNDGGGSIPDDPDAIQSFIFSGGNPNLAGTVGLGQLQDLLLEPIANRTFSISRFELTNVDVGALEDIGWTVVDAVASQPGDFNGDLLVTAADYATFRDTVGTPAAVGTFVDFVANFDTAATSAAASSFAIPEPGTLALSLAGLVFAGRRWGC